jgi:hypothetical protein
MTRAGLPHSGFLGSLPASGSPRLIAAGHALHRLLMPRHPPYALCSLTTVLLLVTHTSLGVVICPTTIQLSKNNGPAPFRRAIFLHDVHSSVHPTGSHVELTRIERATSCLQSRRSPN